MLTVSENLGLLKIKENNLSNTDDDDDYDDFEYSHEYLHVNVLDIFCKNFIRGFSKLVIDLGFDNFILDEIKID